MGSIAFVEVCVRHKLGVNDAENEVVVVECAIESDCSVRIDWGGTLEVVNKFII